MLKDDLGHLGLNKHETQVYLALVGHGSVRAAKIIQTTNLHRQLVYQALERLGQRHLVSRTQRSGVAHFQATDPEHLHDQLREQSLLVERVIESLRIRSHLLDHEVIVHEGEEVIRAFCAGLAERLQAHEKLYLVGSEKSWLEDAAMKKSLAHLLRAVIAHQGRARLLLENPSLHIHAFLTGLKSSCVELRPLPFDINPLVYTLCSEHTVSFFVLQAPYTVIEIRNAHLAQAHQVHFDVLWRQHVRIEQGTEALERAFYGMVEALEPGEEYCVLGGNLGHHSERLSGFFDAYHHHRIERGVVANILAQHPYAAGIRQRNKEQGDPDERVSHVKVFETPFLSPMQINLYKQKAVMVMYKDDGPLVLSFEDPEAYEGFKLYFDEIWQRTTETLHGQQGIISLCERVLETEQDLYLIGATGTIASTHPEYYRDFTKRRATKGIRMHALANEYTRQSGAFTRLPLTDVRYLPKAFASPMVIWIFGDTVAQVLWREPQTIFLLHDAQTADYYRTYYRALEAVAKI